MVRSALRSHHLAAIALACVLSAVWAWQDWSNLSALRLPDTDDVMRLQQVRDWIAGQAFADVSQHRLAGGLAMHWSRIGDAVPAAIILASRPFAGQHGGEIAAVLLWPMAQFTALLILVGSIAERLETGSRGTAILLAALAYPATALFMPGRIDHHGLQVLLVLVQLNMLGGPPTRASGVVLGVAAAVGAAIGLETLPFTLAIGAGVVLGGGVRQQGFGLAAAFGLVALLPWAGRGGVCDTIGPLIWPAVAGALAIAVFDGPRRLPLLASVGVAITALWWPAVRPCLSGPYGNVDPLVTRLWLDQVAEAQPLAAAPLVQAVGYAGLMLVGLGAGLWLAWRRPGGWCAVVMCQLVGLAVTFSQLRGVYVGAALAAVPIAALLVEARARGRTLRVIALWLGGAGLLYPIAARALATPTDDPGGASASCTAPDALARLAALPPGVLMAPIDLGAHAIAATRLRVVAAPYHRNDAGNAAMLRFFLGDPARAEAIARRWRVDYVALCSAGFGNVVPPPRSIAGGASPNWLTPISPPGVEPRIFAIHRRLPPPRPAA